MDGVGGFEILVWGVLGDGEMRGICLFMLAGWGVGGLE